MNSKTIIAAVIVVIAVVAVAIAINSGGDDENKGYTGVVYEGNGGKTLNGDDTFRLTSETVMSNMFTNGDKVFNRWNTKADGTGTSYKSGDSISYPEHGYVTLYAQWAYRLNIATSSGDCQYYLLETGKDPTHITGGSVALPSDGTAGLAIFAPEGTVWVKNTDHTFTGTNGNVTYKLTVSLGGCDTVQAEVNSADPAIVVISFTYSGNVSGSVTYSTTSSSPVA